MDLMPWLIFASAVFTSYSAFQWGRCRGQRDVIEFMAEQPSMTQGNWLCFDQRKLYDDLTDRFG